MINATDKHISGSTSSFIPGDKGDNGHRARLTYISSVREGYTGDQFLIEQYRLSDDENKIIIGAINELGHQLVGEINESGYNKKEDSSTYPDWDQPFTNDNPLGNIIQQEHIKNQANLTLETTEFEGYKFYETDVLNIDSSVGYVAKIPNSYIMINVPEFDNKPKVIKRLQEYPEPYDYIIYIDKNNTYLLMIEDVLSDNIYEPIECKCKILDTWKTSSGSITNISDVDDITETLKIYCINQSISRPKMTNSQLYATPITISYIPDDTLMKNFTIISSKGKIGKYKISAEFVHNTDINLLINRDVAFRFTNDETDRTYIGNWDTYEYDNGRYESNFDHECLGTYEIIIKDYNDGVGEISYNSSSAFYMKNTDNYTINLYITYDKTNGGQNKVLINTFQSYDEFLAWDDLTKKVV